MCIRLLLNKCAWTSFENKNPLLHPIFVTLSNKVAMLEIKKFLEKKFDTFEMQEDFHEIYVKDHNYGVTISFVTEEGGTMITSYVHNKKNPYRVKKYLINFLLPIREHLKDYITNK